MTAPDSPLAAAAATLDTLRRGTAEGALGARTDLAPGLFLAADPALGLTGTWRSPPGRMVELVARPTGSGAWCGLHLALGPLDLGGGAILGLAARLAAPAPLPLMVALRSGDGSGGFTDAAFDRHILARPDAGLHLDAIDPARREDVPARAPWRELVLFLPLTASDLALHDLRVFLT